MAVGNCCCENRLKMTISVAVIVLAIFAGISAIVVIALENKVQPNSVRFVALVFRHGDRSPTDVYPTDPHQNYPWPGGLGALSSKGSAQLFELGRRLSEQYKHLMPENRLYSKENMFVISSYAERCLMSAQSFLAGFMPPLKQQNPLPIPWQPIAVNSIPRNQDRIVAQKATCPMYDKMLREMYTNPPAHLRDYNQRHAELYQYLAKYTAKNVSNVEHVETLYNILSIQQDNNLTLPSWTAEVFPDKMLPVAARNLELITETQYMKKMKGGAFLTDLIDRLVANFEENSKKNQKIFIYSAHDVSLVNIMRALEVTDQTSNKPDYGATLAFELHQVDGEKDLEMKIFYNFDHSKEAKQLKIPNCAQPCLLSDFVASVEHLLVPNFEELCKINSN